MSAELKLTADGHAALAERIFAALKAGQGIDPPSNTLDYTFADAYQVRRLLVDRLIADGARPRGHKIGFTSKAMQEMYGMTGPDFGQLLDTMFVTADAPIAIGHLSDTRVEPELAFEMAEPLAGPGVTLERALAATRRVWPAAEVIDSRVGATRARATDSIADNAGAGLVILGAQAMAPGDLDLAEIAITLSVDGGEPLVGRSGDVMGHPAAPVAWLANKLAEIDGIGGRIQAGDIIMSGSCTRSVAVAPGSRMVATFGPLGRLEATFA